MISLANSFILRAVILVMWLVVPSLVRAEHLPAPTGEIILEVTGPMQNGNSPHGAVFDLALLQEMGQVSFETATPWTVGVQEFKGISLRKLLDHVGAMPSLLEVIAVNEYRSEIPVSEAIEGGPILAWQQEGKLLSVREKGPLWLIYPYDREEKYRTDAVYARSVWQVVQINLVP
jgi:hypothetical protein